MQSSYDPVPLYEHLAHRNNDWQPAGRGLGLVVGDTAPEPLVAVRRSCPDRPLLIPGIGAQAETQPPPYAKAPAPNAGTSSAFPAASFTLGLCPGRPPGRRRLEVDHKRLLEAVGQN